MRNEELIAMHLGYSGQSKASIGTLEHATGTLIQIYKNSIPTHNRKTAHNFPAHVNLALYKPFVQ